MWRDPEGRGSFFGGALDGPQVAAIVMVLLGGLMLRDRKVLQAAIEGGPVDETTHGSEEADHG